MNMQLVVISGADQGRSFSLTDGQTLVVGRGQASETGLSDTQVTDEGVKKFQAELPTRDINPQPLPLTERLFQNSSGVILVVKRPASRKEGLMACYGRPASEYMLSLLGDSLLAWQQGPVILTCVSPSTS